MTLLSDALFVGWCLEDSGIYVSMVSGTRYLRFTDAHKFLGKWYRLAHPRGRISLPEDKFTLQTLKNVLDKPDDLKNWEAVPCPSPLHSDLSYVYTIDKDANLFMISMWKMIDGSLTPTTVQTDLTKLYESSNPSIESILQEPQYAFRDNASETKEVESAPVISGPLMVELGIPTPLNELQEQLSIDFVFLWRFYIDDPLTWRHDSPAFKVLCIAFLRLAAWDFEVSSDSNVELPIWFLSVPSWSYPKTDIYWFHGYLVALQENIESEVMISRAITKVKTYLDDHSIRHNAVRLILLSPRHVAFAELVHDAILASKSLILLTNHSAIQPSPGFRALIRIFTSNCWKVRQTNREKWRFNLPPEILQTILHELEPRDTVALSQASLAVEEWYYATIPQFKNISLQEFKLSIPCCGKRGGLKEYGIRCHQCCSWRHLNCVGLQTWPPGKEYICMDCQEGKTSMAHTPGGINWFSRRKRRAGRKVTVGEFTKSLHLRLSKPSHLRRDLQFLGNLVAIPPRLIQYTVVFNGTFSGLAYGLEEDTP